MQPSGQGFTLNQQSSLVHRRRGLVIEEEESSELNSQEKNTSEFFKASNSKNSIENVADTAKPKEDTKENRPVQPPLWRRGLVTMEKESSDSNSQEKNTSEFFKASDSKNSIGNVADTAKPKEDTKETRSLQKPHCRRGLVIEAEDELSVSTYSKSESSETKPLAPSNVTAFFNELKSLLPSIENGVASEKDRLVFGSYLDTLVGKVINGEVPLDNVKETLELLLRIKESLETTLNLPQDLKQDALGQAIEQLTKQLPLVPVENQESSMPSQNQSYEALNDYCKLEDNNPQPKPIYEEPLQGKIESSSVEEKQQNFQINEPEQFVEGERKGTQEKDNLTEEKYYHDEKIEENDIENRTFLRGNETPEERIQIYMNSLNALKYELEHRDRNHLDRGGDNLYKLGNILERMKKLLERVNKFAENNRWYEEQRRFIYGAIRKEIVTHTKKSVMGIQGTKSYGKKLFAVGEMKLLIDAGRFLDKRFLKDPELVKYIGKHDGTLEASLVAELREKSRDEGNEAAAAEVVCTMWTSNWMGPMRPINVTTRYDKALIKLERLGQL